MLEARHLRRIIKAADRQLRAMVLLGINCGFGNHERNAAPVRRRSAGQLNDCDRLSLGIVSCGCCDPTLGFMGATGTIHRVF